MGVFYFLERVDRMGNSVELDKIENIAEVQLIAIRTSEEGMLNSWQSYEEVEPVDT